MLETFLTTVRVRAGPSISTEKVEKYCEGVIVRYDSTVENEGRLWISHIGRSGNRRFCCARDNTGEWYINIKSLKNLIFLSKKFKTLCCEKLGILLFMFLLFRRIK